MRGGPKSVRPARVRCLAWVKCALSPSTTRTSPDHRSPGRLLWWLVKGQWRTMLGGMLFGIAWMLSQAADAGRHRLGDRPRRDRQGHRRAARSTPALMFGIGVVRSVAAIMRHRFAVTNWLTAAYRVVQLVTRQAVRLGATLPKRVATGEVVAIGNNDLSHVGNAMDDHRPRRPARSCPSSSSRRCCCAPRSPSACSSWSACRSSCSASPRCSGRCSAAASGTAR